MTNTEIAWLGATLVVMGIIILALWILRNDLRESRRWTDETGLSDGESGPPHGSRKVVYTEGRRQFHRARTAKRINQILGG